MELNTILKRLDVLKNVIALQDADDIEFQSGKLKKLIDAELADDLKIEINGILKLVENKAFGNAMEKIKVLLNKYTALSKWADPEVQGLKAEVRALSEEIIVLENEISEADKTIHLFEVKQIQILGDIIIELLALKKKLAAKKVQENPQDTEAQNQYKESETDEKEYQGIYDEAKKNPVQKLSPEEEQELTTLFRKIAKLTHPDVVDKRFEKQAAALFDKAKKAKDNNDLDSLRQIMDYLMNNTPFTFKVDSITEKELLRKEVGNLRTIIQQLKDKLYHIQNSETYKSIISISDWDVYFYQTKETLQRELENLKKAAADIESSTL